MVSLKHHAEAFDAAWKKLGQHWQTTHSQWRDKTQQDFSQQFWLPLEQQVKLTQRELDNLISVIERAKSNLR
jgi:spore coat polysaccharide biosynthesis protein SpsF (cytidylyltransferase family)